MDNKGNVQKIASFKIDHDKLVPGIYVSRIDGDCVTYDLRTRKPNSGAYMNDVTLHSVEHMFATYIRSSAIKDSVIYLFRTYGMPNGLLSYCKRKNKRRGSCGGDGNA